MFEKLTDPKDVLLWEGEIPIRHRYTPGVAGEAFFKALRDRGEFLASPCTGCSITYSPPRLFCERCFTQLEPDTMVGPGGILESFTVGHVDVDGESLDRPLMVGLVRLDGADTVLMHLLIEYERPAIGDRVEAVLQPNADRVGSIMDIRGFRPART